MFQSSRRFRQIPTKIFDGLQVDDKDKFQSSRRFRQIPTQG